MRILAASIAGRPVEVAPAEAGDRTWTDGQAIYLEAGAEPDDRLRMLAVQASLLAAGSLDATVLRALRHRRTLARRYLAVEGHRALVANHGALPPWMGAMIDHEVAGRVGSATDSLALARRERALEAPPLFGTIGLARLERGLAAAPASAPAADDRVEPMLDSDAELADDDDGAPDLGALLASPVGGSGAIGRLLAKLLRSTRAADGSGDRSGPAGAGTPTHASAAAVPTGRRAVTSLELRSGTFEATDPLDLAPPLYPEWDVRTGAYRPDWCRVVDEVGDRSAVTGALPTDSLPSGAALRPPLARLGTGLTPCRRRREGDDVDVDAAVDARVGVLTGAPHTEDVYIENVRRRRDLSVLVLLDVSGSAAEPGVAGITVHDHQREAAGALVAALHGLGDRVALCAFSSSGRGAVRVARVKGFGEPLDLRVGQRLHALEPGAYTRLGAAIRHGSHVLEAEGGTPRRLLIVLSDGLAYDHGYEGRYAEADARRALLEARRQGIGCLCLTVGAQADPAALRRVFGSAAHATVPSVDGLPGVIGPLSAAALRSAEVKRRSFQRTERTRERLLVDGRLLGHERRLVEGGVR